jgi:iron complex transport system permease protein
MAHVGDADLSAADFIVLEMRFPRMLTGALAGASLAVAGAIIQAISRNPLGSPDLVGVSSGASFFVVLGVVVFNLPISGLLIVGTLGGFFAGAMTFFLAWRVGLSPLQIILSGVCIGLFFNAAITLLLLAGDADINGLYYWLAGSLNNTDWRHVEQLYPFVLCGLTVSFLFFRTLDMLGLDEMTSRSLGLNLIKWRLILGITSVVLTASTVATAGPIAFIGLVAPHIVSLIFKSTSGRLSHKTLLPLTALTGAFLVVIADVLAKHLQIPVGILCILTGGPLLVILIKRQKI